MHTSHPWMRHRTNRPEYQHGDAESRLWARLRDAQVHGVQCYRRRSISTFLVDFYLPGVKLVIEVDDSQQFSIEDVRADAARSVYLRSLGLAVLRFSRLQVLNEIESVMEDIHAEVGERLAGIEIAKFALQRVAEAASPE